MCLSRQRCPTWVIRALVRPLATLANFACAPIADVHRCRAPSRPAPASRPHFPTRPPRFQPPNSEHTLRRAPSRPPPTSRDIFTKSRLSRAQYSPRIEIGDKQPISISAPRIMTSHGVRANPAHRRHPQRVQHRDHRRRSCHASRLPLLNLNGLWHRALRRTCQLRRC